MVRCGVSDAIALPTEGGFPVPSLLGLVTSYRLLISALFCGSTPPTFRWLKVDARPLSCSTSLCNVAPLYDVETRVLVLPLHRRTALPGRDAWVDFWFSCAGSDQHAGYE